MTTKTDHPDRKRCMQYLRDYNTPQHVIGHCIAVAETACRLGEALNRAGGTRAPKVSDLRYESFDTGRGHRGYKVDTAKTVLDTGKARQFDLALVEAAGILHDMARVEDRHWDVAADFCEREGLTEEAGIIRVHMQYEFTQDAWLITETDLVCLGDRLVLEDHYAGIDKRMDYIIAKAERNGNMHARPVILRKKEETKVLLRQIEERIGMSLDDLMSDTEYDR